MRNKNALNPYRIESGAYYNLRKILAPKWGDGALDEYKRKHRAELKRHIDPLEKSAGEDWRTAPNGARYCVCPWLGESEEDLARIARSFTTRNCVAGGLYYTGYAQRTGRDGKNVAYIIYQNYDC